MTKKPKECLNCPINHLTQGFVPPVVKGKHGQMVVNEAAGESDVVSGLPLLGGVGQWFGNLCKCAKLERDKLSICNTICCRPPENIYPTDVKWHHTSREDARRAVDYCARTFLWPAVEKAQPFKVIALGNHSLERLTGKSGIGIWRGSPLPLLGKASLGPRVIPTLHPTQLMKQAKLFSVVVKDLQKSCVLPPERYNLFPTLAEVKQFKSKEFAFDFEWDIDGDVTLCGLSDRYYSAIVIPFEGSFIDELQRIFESATKIIGHNIIGADLKWIEKWGWKVKAEYHDTMLKQHLIQPDYPHDLGFVASVFTNKVFWKGKGREEEDDDGNVVLNNVQWRTWDQPHRGLRKEHGGYVGCRSALEAYRLYNARDTEAEFQINFPLSQALKKYDIENVYWNVSVPIAQICREMSEHGIRIDRSRLGEVRAELDKNIEELEGRLPTALKPKQVTVNCNLPAPEGTYKVKVKKCKGNKKQPHEVVEMFFEKPGQTECPKCGKLWLSGKMDFAKIVKGTREETVVPYNSPQELQKYAESVGCKVIFNPKTGAVSTDKRARKFWAAEHPEFVLLDALKKNITLRNNFAKDALLEQEWMYFSLRPHGTGEGRLASSGRREGIDLNIQNQPEEFRIIYVPDEPGQGILNLDISQGESQLTTWLAEDWGRWERIQQKDYDEHCDLASRIFGRSISKSKQDKPFRDVGKKINHGRNYGMGIRKQRDVLLEEGYSFSETDIKEFIHIWEELNPGTARWQKRTIETAQRQGFLVNPFGRKRWFQTRDFATKSLAFLPASTLADMVLRMMIAHFPSKERIWPAIKNLGLERYADLVDGWRMAIQVHDSLVLIGPDQTWKEQAFRTKEIMTMKWKELNNFSFNVDLKYSTKSWGECKTVEV